MDITLRHNTLKHLRESRGIPISVMPGKLGITLDAYNELEVADSTQSIDFANRVAGIFNRNWSVFLSDNPPIIIKSPHDNRTVDNQSPILHQSTIEASEDADFIIGFSQSISSGFRLQIPKLSEIKQMDAETLGKFMRDESNISIEDQINIKDISTALKTWIHFIEAKGIYVSHYPLSSEDKIRAFSIFKNDRAIIVLNSLDSFSGRIFSLFHEYCHIIRRTQGYCDLHHSKSITTEVFCNAFAAAFLLPLNYLETYIKTRGISNITSQLEHEVKILANKVKLSPIVIYRRLTTIGLLSNDEYAAIHKKILSEFPRKSNRNQGGGMDYYELRRIRNGNSYTTNIFEALHSGQITQFEASNALGVATNNLDKYRYKSEAA
jgi:Zn-dependent peptidase ImmA (M78 family)/transcriptional regulator with XRE-family HTH domain